MENIKKNWVKYLLYAAGAIIVIYLIYYFFFKPATPAPMVAPVVVNVNPTTPSGLNQPVAAAPQQTSQSTALS